MRRFEAYLNGDYNPDSERHDDDLSAEPRPQAKKKQKQSAVHQGNDDEHGQHLIQQLLIAFQVRSSNQKVLLFGCFFMLQVG